MDRIKLVYNWIGPLGPIWNTELPNVLNFAKVAEGVSNLESRKFFCDDLVHFFDAYRDNRFEIYPVVSIRHNDWSPFIIPFTLSWRVPFNNYFTGNEGILEYSHIPFHAVNFVRHRNGYILINHSIEAFMNSSYLDVLHSYFGSVHHIPLHKIIYLTGCINAQEIYDNYCDSKNIPNDPYHRLSIVTHPTSFTSFIENTKLEKDMPPYDTETVPFKLFLMWNRRLRSHRVELSMNLERHNLVDRSFISFSNEDVDFPGQNIEHQFDRGRLMNVFNINDDTINKFCDRLPLVLDGLNDITVMCQDYDNMTRNYYQQSLVSIITETNFYDREVSLTEKSFKPTKEKHPFIIAGVKGVLKGMHELGFKTFGEFWDESYDDIEDSTERMRKIMDVVGYIGTWSDDQILDFRRKVKPILDHNYEVIRNAGSDRAVEKIISIVRNGMIYPSDNN